MGDRENKKNYVYNAKTNAVNNEVAIYDSIDIKDESENQNNTKEINTDEIDEKNQSWSMKWISFVKPAKKCLGLN